jgi:nucleoside phosphorylase
MEKCDVVIVTALPVERQAVLAYLQDVREEAYSAGTVYQTGTFHGEQSTRNIVVIGGAGNGKSHLMVKLIEERRMIDHFRPQILFSVGIARGLKDVRLGDVLVANQIYRDEVGGMNTSMEPSVDFWRSDLEQWVQGGARNGWWLRPLDEQQFIDPPHVFVGPLLSKSRERDSMVFNASQWTHDPYEDALAMDVEEHRLLQAALPSSPGQTWVIRGISHVIHEPEPVDRLGWQEMAARHAAAFVFAMVATLPKESPPKAFTPRAAVFGGEDHWFQARLRWTSIAPPHLPRWEEIVYKRSLQRDAPFEEQALHRSNEERPYQEGNDQLQQLAHACQACGEYVALLRQKLEANGWTHEISWNWDRTKVQELEELIDVHSSDPDFRGKEQLQLIRLLLETLASLLSRHLHSWPQEAREVLREMAIQACQDLLSNLADLLSQMDLSDASTTWPTF